MRLSEQQQRELLWALKFHMERLNVAELSYRLALAREDEEFQRFLRQATHRFVK